MKNAD